MHRTALHPLWTKHHTSVAVAFMLGNAIFYRKAHGINTAVYNPVTRKWDGGREKIWEGKIRLQPFGLAGDQMVAQDPTGRRVYRAQIETRESGIQVDDQMYLTEIEFDSAPEMLNYVGEVRSTVTSTNSWLTDMTIEFDVKSSGK